MPLKKDTPALVPRTRREDAGAHMAQRDEADWLRSRLASGEQQPEITAEMRANARQNPDSWLYVIDEAFDPSGQVPPWAVVGAYPVNGSGMIVSDFHPNERYRPSPRALGFPEPGTKLEHTLQLVRTKHRPREDLPKAILEATLFVYAMSPVQRSVIGFHDQEGRVLVPAYTSKSMVPAEWPHARAVLGRDVVELLDGHPIAVNPHSPVTVVVPAAQLIRALTEQRPRGS